VTEVTGRCARVRQKCDKFPMKTNLIYSFAFLARFFLKIVPTKYKPDVTIEDEIRPVNLLCSSKVTYPTDRSHA
jgi:hypothetical protein